MNFSNILGFAEDGKGGNGIWTTVFFIVIAVLFLGMMVWSSFNNRKRDKKAQEMMNNIGPGDKIKTVGGLVGTIVEIIHVGPDKLMVIESGVGDNKTTMTYDMRAIGVVMEHANTPAFKPELVQEIAPEGDTKKIAAVEDTSPVNESSESDKSAE